MTSYLFLRIDQTTKRGVQVQYYALRRLAEKAEVRIAWDLIGKRASYVVTLYENGEVDCTCEDFGFRRQKMGELCKHAGAIIDLVNRGELPSSVSGG